MEKEVIINKLIIKKFGKLYSEKLGINLNSRKEKEIFKWFLASILFGKRIGENIAMNTYREFEKAGLLTPDKISQAGWDELVNVLDRGGYVRFDFSTSTKLLNIMKDLKEKYGSLENLHKVSKDSEDLEKRLQEFKGIGPITTNIFLREMRTVWKKANPEPSPLVKLAARNLKINLDAFNKKSKMFIKLEAALLRVGKNYCRKRKCKTCEFEKYCKLK